MIYAIESDKLKVSAKSPGAELTSIQCKKTGIEYLWQADKAYWGQHAPVLFPSVGGTKNSTYYKGQQYNMGFHGFAHSSHFAVKQEPDRLIFSLTSSAETMKDYPFEFLLEVIFTLDGNCLRTEYRVTNLSQSEDLIFGIGAHPGYNLPIVAGTEFGDYYLEFPGFDYVSHNDFTDQGLLLDKTIQVPLENSCIPLSYEFFEKMRTLLLVDTPVKKVCIRSRKTEHFICMEHEAAHFAVWSRPGPYVCLEPWDGLPDRDDAGGDFATKKGNHILPAGGVKTFKHDVTFG